MTEAETRTDRFRRAVAGATAALAERAGVVVTYTSAETATTHGTQVSLPVPPQRMSQTEIGQFRGAADSVALWLRYHDPKAHVAIAPVSAEARLAFDACERARVESLGAVRMHGVAANLDHHLIRQVAAEGIEHPRERGEVPVAWALRLLLQERLTRRPLPMAARTLANLWRPILESRAGGSLNTLADAVSDQSEFGRAARRVLADLGLEDESGDTNRAELDPDGQNSAEGADTASGEHAAADDDLNTFTTATDVAETSTAENNQANADLMDPSGAEGVDFPGGPTSPHRPSSELPGPVLRYHAFTNEYDTIEDAATLCDAEELARLRVTLDKQLHKFQRLVARLANRLQRLLLAKQMRSWEFDLDEGVIDAARLARIVANPSNPLSYKQEKDTDFRDTIVTLLLDNSGSMRGRPITVAALCADILARTLERCGVKVEVLGFTTRAWKGGQSRDRWVAEGKPPHPGRLNDLLHIIYKSADEPLRRARRKFGLMLREGLLKENIDGEALMWAHQRLLDRPEARRILMVISDGAPIDDSTLSANSSNYMDRHLRGVIGWIEARSPVELTAIGIGHDATCYYSRAVTIADTEQLGEAMMDQLADLFENAPRKRSTLH